MRGLNNMNHSLIDIAHSGAFHEIKDRRFAKDDTFTVPKKDVKKWKKQLAETRFKYRVFNKMAKYYDKHADDVAAGYKRAIVLAQGGEV